VYDWQNWNARKRCFQNVLKTQSAQVAELRADIRNRSGLGISELSYLRLAIILSPSFRFSGNSCIECDPRHDLVFGGLIGAT
jgi:hypothetical protein